MKLTPEQIQTNWDKLIKLIKINFDGERQEKLLKMYNDFKDRMMLAPAFSQKAIANYEAMVRELAHDIVKNALSKIEFDAVEKMAKQLPMMMLGRILGLPDSDLEWLVLKGDALIGNSDPEFTDHIIDKLDSDQYRFMPFRSPAALELYDYAEKILNQDININKNGVLSKETHETVVRFAPPLTITEKDLLWGIKAFEKSLKSLG